MIFSRSLSPYPRYEGGNCIQSSLPISVKRPSSKDSSWGATSADNMSYPVPSELAIRNVRRVGILIVGALCDGQAIIEGQVSDRLAKQGDMVRNVQNSP